MALERTEALLAQLYRGTFTPPGSGRIQWQGLTRNHAKWAFRGLLDGNGNIVKYGYYLVRALRLIDWLENHGMTASDRLIVVNSGFGFLPAAFRRRGYPNVWGIDAASYFQNNFASEYDEDYPSLEPVWEDWTANDTQAVQDALIAKTGDWRFDAIITEDLVRFYADAELLPIANACERALTDPATRGGFARIIHMVQCALPNPGVWPNEDGDEVAISDADWLAMNHVAIGGLRWLTFDEWVAKRPAHSWVNLSSFYGPTVEFHVGTG